MQLQNLKIPSGSILGLNYSGMHDSAIAIVSKEGYPVYASSLERYSRYKQDGRPPSSIINKIPWDKIDTIAISTDEKIAENSQLKSKFLEVRIPDLKKINLHGESFYEFLDTLPCNKEFVCHQMAHASSAFWNSPFQNSICLTYDGGMLNSPWFGGVFTADKQQGIELLEGFSANNFAKITTLYSFITALLGFSPLRHEGKITGLSALGKPNKSVLSILDNWFKEQFLEIEKCINWHFVYEKDLSPVFFVNDAEIRNFKEEISNFKKEDIAASVQKYTEKHVLKIIDKVSQIETGSKNICLAGGLFANVKLNQRIYETKLFDGLFVAPAMTDDGTALGAALHVASKKGREGFKPPPASMYLGHSPERVNTKTLLDKYKIHFSQIQNPPSKIAKLLSEGKVVGLFQGAMEFGPRALGNRSILSAATDININTTLNKKLSRTEFMPFAPVTRFEDVEGNYKNTSGILDTLKFMTITVNCTENMRKACPAVVHVDGTARPQLVTKDENQLLHNILTEYQKLTKINSLINTSFNSHEEPIVRSVEDAIRALFVSGIDYLFIDGGFLINLDKNRDCGYEFLTSNQNSSDEKHKVNIQLLNSYAHKDMRMRKELAFKEALIQEKEIEISNLSAALDRLWLLSLAISWLYMPFKQVFLPKLGEYKQYHPRDLVENNPTFTFSTSQSQKFSIVIPSFNHAKFITTTIKSILAQNYQNAEIFVSDGGSTDGTKEILRSFESQLNWVSEKDNGQAHAINKGFAKTNGEIMAWINSDDILLPNTLKIVADHFLRHPEVDVIYGDRIIIDRFNREIGRWALPKHDEVTIDWVDFIPQETLFWRRRIWNEIGENVDETFEFALDWDLILRFKKAKANFLHIPYFLGGFRAHNEQKSNVLIDDIGKKEMGRLRKRSLGYIPSQKEIRVKILPYLVKHVLAHIQYLVRKRKKHTEKNIISFD